MQVLSPTLDRPPSVVLVDLDDTLYPYAPSHAAGLRGVQQYAEAQLGIDASQFERAFAQGRAVVQQRIAGTASSHHRLLYAQAALELLGRAGDAEAALGVERAYWDAFLAGAQLHRGVIAFIDLLDRHAVPLALVTDLIAAVQFRKLVHFGLNQRFTAIVTSEESGYDKPNAASYRLAMQKLAAAGKDTSRPWMIGDDATKDIAAARAAIGAVTLRKLPSTDPAEPEAGAPDIVFDDFEALHDYLARLLSRSR